MTHRLAVLISGSGTNLQAIMAAIDSGRLDAAIAVVLSNRADAGGLTRAKNAGIATEVLDHRQYDSREAFDQAMISALDHYQPGTVVLAGFMRILTPLFIGAYAGRMLNIHPSLLPKYRGLHTHARALDAGDAEAFQQCACACAAACEGCSVRDCGGLGLGGFADFQSDERDVLGVRGAGESLPSGGVAEPFDVQSNRRDAGVVEQAEGDLCLRCLFLIAAGDDVANGERACLHSQVDRDV